MKRKNLVLATYDCARADVLHRGIAPNFERLAKRGVNCRNAISSAPLTPVSHATIMTGLQPWNHGLRGLLKDPMREGLTNLAEVLSADGWDTGAIVACPGLNAWYGFGRGFNAYDDAVPNLPDGSDPFQCKDVKYRGLAMKRADEVADLAIAWLQSREQDTPWFLFAHFFDAHWPYEPPVDRSEAANSYEGELLYADHHFGRILDEIEGRGELDDTLIIAYGDHGEDLEGWYENDKGGEELGHPEENGHGTLLFNQTQHVPMVISSSDYRTAAYSGLVGLVDIYPTVLSALGLECPPDRDGIDLTPMLEGSGTLPERFLFAETCHRTEVSENNPQFSGLENLQAVWESPTVKAIRSFSENDQGIMFDLSNDPNEIAPIQLSAETAGRFEWPPRQ